jgi:hypothetical protein
VRVAKENLLAANEARQDGAATRARQTLMNAAKALDGARMYRDRAEVAARRAVGLPVDVR